MLWGRKAAGEGTWEGFFEEEAGEKRRWGALGEQECR